MHGQLGCVDKYKVTVFPQTRWGTHSLTTSIRALLKEALNDVQNQRFVLLSEWDIPLYPPRVVYLQLMAEQASRIDACPGPMVCAPFLLGIPSSRLGFHTLHLLLLRCCTVFHVVWT